MKFAAFIVGVVLTAFIRAQTVPTTPTTPSGPVIVMVGSTVIERSVSIQLGVQVIEGIVPQTVVPPHVVHPGTRLRFLALPPGATHGPVQWFKGSERLAATGATLEIAAVTTADSGSYSCAVLDANGRGAGSGSVVIFVPPNPGQRLSNLSTRARIDAAQPSFLSGFVVEPGPAAKLVLVRAIGPALTDFGVNGALAAPQLRLLDARGREISPNTFPFAFPSVTDATRRVGAFPLPAGSKDVAQLFYLSPGAYAAQVSSADAGSGVALLEIYDVGL